MSEVEGYTPSTDEVREFWEEGRRDWRGGVMVEMTAAGFDRWLASERARIWDEGYRQGWDDRNDDFRAGYVPSGFQQDTANPYRKGGDA